MPVNPVILLRRSPDNRIISELIETGKEFTRSGAKVYSAEIKIDNILIVKPATTIIFPSVSRSFFSSVSLRLMNANSIIKNN